MKISRITMVSLGVNNLIQATEFYRQVLNTSPNTSSEAITFVELPGAWLSLYPLEKLAQDISPDVPITRNAFSGMTLAYNARSKDEVVAIMKRVKEAGGQIVKEAQDTFWGGFSGYFSDLDGYYWEVAWGPMFEFDANGNMKLSEGSSD